MDVIQKKVVDLTQDKKNARQHDKRNLEAIKNSLEKFGQQKPVVINKDGEIIAGNGTVLAALELGWKKVDVVVSTLTEMKQRAFSIADNRTAELAKWDYIALGDAFEELMGNFDLGDLGWEDFETDPIMNREFKAGEVEDWNVDTENQDHRNLVAIRVPKEQHAVITEAMDSVRYRDKEIELKDGDCLEIICKEWKP